MPTSMPSIPGVADFDVFVNGSPLSARYKSHITGITVEKHTRWPGMFEIRIASSHYGKTETEWIDDTTSFSIGNEVEIHLGYVDELESVLTGEITGLEPEFSSGMLPVLVVRGFDRGHRLQRNRKTRTFTQQKDSDIASAIAQEAGLTGDVTDSNVTHEYVCQALQTDMEFLMDRARRINYEVIIDGKNLVFRPVPYDASEIVTLTLQDDLLQFYPRLSTVGQQTEIQVKSWNPKDKKEITGTAVTGSELSTMGGSSSGAQTTSDAYGDAVSWISTMPAASQAQADQVAEALYNEAVLMLITGEGTCRGRTDLSAGKVIKIDGVGTRFSGNYYLTSVVHRYRAQRGFTTNITFRRSGV